MLNLRHSELDSESHKTNRVFYDETLNQDQGDEMTIEQK